MRFRQQRKEDISLGVSIAPLIDIIFLLLIFFMLTSHFDIKSDIDVQLPDSSERRSFQPGNTLTVTIDEKGNCYLEKKKLTLKNLYLKLQEHANKKKVSLVLNADRDAKHRYVVRIMDLARKAGINSIAIAVKWKEERVL
ncbi:MAG: ExbD/TolR family protein [Thermodesulfobacteriota bacterium]